MHLISTNSSIDYNYLEILCDNNKVVVFKKEIKKIQVCLIEIIKISLLKYSNCVIFFKKDKKKET